MIITVASYKGGVGKTTTAIHLAPYFHRLAPTLLIDGDIIRASTKWSRRSNGKGFPFKVVDESQTAKYAREYINGHIIIDTEANPSNTDFRQVAEGCDLLVIPAVPETTATDGLTYTLEKLYEIGNDRYRVLLTKVPPKPRTDSAQLRAMLVQNQQFPRSTELRGGGWHRSAKASRSEDSDIEEPVACWYASAFHFHTTLPGILGSMLIRDEIIQMREPYEKRL